MSYILDDPKPLEPAHYLGMSKDDNNEDAEEFAENVTTTLPKFNESAVLEALVAWIHPTNTIQNIKMPDNCTQNIKLDSGTSAYRCELNPNAFVYTRMFPR